MNGPDFVDNRNGNTLAQALNELLALDANEGEAIQSAETPEQIRIATAYFSASGFAQIADLIAAIPKVKMMLGADLNATTPAQRKELNETQEMFERRLMNTGLYRIDNLLQRERDHIPFTRANGKALQKLITALNAGNMEVRRYEETFLHAKAYIFTRAEGNNTQPQGIIAGSSNLTGAGLSRNLELNLGRFDQPIVEKATRWFDELWEEAVPYDLASIFEEVFVPRTPWEIFIRVLWRLYGEEVEEDASKDQNLPLTSFQKHGVARAERLIREIGGAIVADEVGLGKTFVAGQLLEHYRDRRQRSLLICPAALRDSTWKKFLNRFQLFVECLSYEQLANDEQLRDRQRPNANQQNLQRSLDEYQFVVIDEAHNYRNPDAPTRAAVLRRLLFGQKRDLLLLTATPVNNSLWDLYHLIRFFIRQDASLAERGILSIRERFERAMREDPSNLSPDILYPVIDATTVKRTREFVKRHYAGDTILGSDGRPTPITFPVPTAMSLRYNLDSSLPGFFDRLEDALDPDAETSISFVRYMPDVFLVNGDDEEDAHAHAMVGLLRSGLLKRFESSSHAFRKTVDKMAHEHDTFIEALSAGYVVSTAFMKELSADDETLFEEILATTEHRTDASLYDIEALKIAVERDRNILRELASEAAKITQDLDPKLHVLTEALAEIAKEAEHEATNHIDAAQKRKVLLFSFFEDTVEWIRDYLIVEMQRNPDLFPYADRMTVVSGSDELGDVSREQAVRGFAPISMEAPTGEDADCYDLLVSTDVLAEGVDLQQCRHIINFDMPWNPMRLVQRHGRIDRIGSPHNRVFLRTIFPGDRLDQLLNLEQRILDKLAMAAASVGVASPIEGAAHGQQVFTETRDEIEKLLREDSSLYERGTTASAAQTGEEYRQTLRKALTQRKDSIVNLPWKVGSGVIQGTRRGVFFCAAVGERTYLRFVPATDEWQPEDQMDAVVREVGTCLRLLECEETAATWYPDGLLETVYDFWHIAQHDVWTEWMRETDPAKLQPKVRPLNLRVAEFIRSHPPFDVSEERLSHTLDILESPWPRREEVLLRQWFENEEQEGAQLSQILMENILATGLEPAEPPPLLPPIEQNDVELFCWLALEPEGNS